ncbi:MAG: sigma-70 family RNA polymerase sigma factor [Lachnospiraceae bacterium]|nr:sigma-70 family RNA polymerase sigma factor [Lachnospiraceae bacterium]
MNNTEYQRLAALYLDTIYRVALNGCKNHTDAEDVVQNTFLKLLKKRMLSQMMTMPEDG